MNSPASVMFVSFKRELLEVARVPKVALILRVFKVLKSYVGRSPLIQFLLVLRDKC